MVDLIVPPILILVLVAVLILVLARTVQNADRDAHRFSFGRTQPKKENPYITAFKKNTGKWRSTLKGMAHRRSVKAAVLEARMEREESSRTSLPAGAQFGGAPSGGDGYGTRPEQVAESSGMSRMGEIILSYHQSIAEGDDMEAYDPVEIRLIQGIEQNPQDPQVYELLGDFYMDRQNYDDARVCYKYVLRLDPRHRRAQEAMRSLDRLL